MGKRYSILRVIATLFRVIGVVVGLGTLIVVIFSLIVGGSLITYNGISRAAQTLASIFTALVLLVGGILGALAVYAVGEVLSLLINIEENTRFSAMVLRMSAPAGQPAQVRSAVPPPPIPAAPPPPIPIPPPTVTVTTQPHLSSATPTQVPDINPPIPNPPEDPPPTAVP